MSYFNIRKSLNIEVLLLQQSYRYFRPPSLQARWDVDVGKNDGATAGKGNDGEGVIRAMSNQQRGRRRRLCRQCNRHRGNPSSCDCGLFSVFSSVVANKSIERDRTRPSTRRQLLASGSF